MPPSPPLFSLIIPTFNPGAKLQATLDSMGAQNCDNLEILVADGGSSDGTPQFLREQTEIKWKSERDKGVFDAMNWGIEQAQGDWLLFMGAGDLLRPGVLQSIEALALENREKLAVLYGDVWLCEENYRYGGPFSRRKLRSWVPNHQGIFYNRRVFEALGGYELEYPIAADYAFNFKCWGDGRVEKIYCPLLISDYEGRGLSKRVVDERFERDKMRLIRQRLGFDAYALRRLETLAPPFLKAARVAVLNKLAAKRSGA